MSAVTGQSSPKRAGSTTEISSRSSETRNFVKGAIKVSNKLDRKQIIQRQYTGLNCIWIQRPTKSFWSTPGFPQWKQHWSNVDGWRKFVNCHPGLRVWTRRFLRIKVTTLQFAINSLPGMLESMLYNYDSNLWSSIELIIDKRSISDFADQAWTERLLQEYAPNFMWLFNQNFDCRILNPGQMVNMHPQQHLALKVLMRLGGLPVVIDSKVPPDFMIHGSGRPCGLHAINAMVHWQSHCSYTHAPCIQTGDRRREICFHPRLSNDSLHKPFGLACWQIWK